MKKQISRFLFIIFLVAFTSSILRASAYAFSELTEETAEELVDLNEEESEKEYLYEYQFDYLKLNTKTEFSYINVAQINGIISTNYAEPHQENLFSPPEC